MERRRCFLVIGKAARKFLLTARLTLALVFLKRRLVTVQIYAVAAFLCHFVGNFHGEAVGIVKVERLFAVNHLFGHVVGIFLAHKRVFALNAIDTFFKFLQALLQGLVEFGFFLDKLFRNLLAVDIELGINLFVVFDKRLGNLGKTTLGQVDFSSVTNGAADNTAQDIALVGVGRHDTLFVAEHKGCRTRVVKKYAERLGYFLAFAVGLARERGNLRNRTLENVRFIYARFAVQNAKRAL